MSSLAESAAGCYESTNKEIRSPITVQTYWSRLYVAAVCSKAGLGMN